VTEDRCTNTADKRSCRVRWPHQLAAAAARWMHPARSANQPSRTSSQRTWGLERASPRMVAVLGPRRRVHPWRSGPLVPDQSPGSLPAPVNADNPRILISSGIAEGRSDPLSGDRIDAIFVPTRGRPGPLVDLLTSLPEDHPPVFVMPSHPDDAKLVRDHKHVHILETRDPSFAKLWNRLQSHTHRLVLRYSRGWDLPEKRSYALWLARRDRLARILLLDDDIRHVASGDLTSAARALDDFAIAGLFVDDFPDTSAVGHAEILAGERVWPFISGSCLFLRSANCTGFFPQIYNEDWLFMLPHIDKHSVCEIGTIGQLPYDPFPSAEVGQFQEFGEIVADGLFELAAQKRLAERRKTAIWAERLRERSEWIGEVRSRVDDPRCLSILRSSAHVLDSVTPSDCVTFIDLWDSDRDRWDSELGRFA
jgi:hypothetical protein